MSPINHFAQNHRLLAGPRRPHPIGDPRDGVTDAGDATVRESEWRGAISRLELPGAAGLFVPLLTATGFTALAWILTGFLVVSGLIGWLWAPRNEGKSLDQLEAERV